MFDSPYPFQKINAQQKKIVDDVYAFEHNYFFRGREKHRYNVIVEQYAFSTYIVKFYLRKYKNAHNRFEMLTGLNECPRVLTTIAEIIKDLFNNDAFASFGFIGSPCEGEEKNNTRRFKLYSRVVANLVSPVRFTHHTNVKNSAYLLLNSDNPEQDLLKKIEAHFSSLYPDLQVALN